MEVLPYKISDICLNNCNRNIMILLLYKWDYTIKSPRSGGDYYSS
ncbi:hypothetical protein ACFP3I_10795 [Chryseobacterium arachidis]